jgi:hypothetical protein
MTFATVDRLVHHATILEMNVDSYRRREAIERKWGQDDRPHARQSKHHPDCRSDKFPMKGGGEKGALWAKPQQRLVVAGLDHWHASSTR